MRHIVDSAQIVAFLENEKHIIVDVGAGAGFPGVVLSILGVKNIILVESDERKASFLREVARILSLNLEIVNDRVENTFIKADIVVARGFSALDKMLDKIENIEYFRMLLLKGENAESEISEASKNWEFCHKKHKSITNSESYILDITNVQRRKN
jgi:16S rRNA (guanine527-N7)-methyltransferase